MNHEHYFNLDETHPIPDLSVVDIYAPRKSGGADLVLIIASPLQNDERSLERLLRKIEVYFGFLGTPEFRSESGEPSAETTSIVVKIHPDSCAEAFELLRQSEAWCREYHASLVVDTALPDVEH